MGRGLTSCGKSFNFLGRALDTGVDKDFFLLMFNGRPATESGWDKNEAVSQALNYNIASVESF